MRFDSVVNYLTLFTGVIIIMLCGRNDAADAGELASRSPQLPDPTAFNVLFYAILIFVCEVELNLIPINVHLLAVLTP